jgi:hypothetical protein
MGAGAAMKQHREEIAQNNPLHSIEIGGTDRQAFDLKLIAG